ncbi:splicing factor 45-like [Daphnia pulicaria]|uniref:splicing factor 45-like n=1 Tax=Daphnia pulicaria TaxID=35523 RepID=UPI001EEBB377|nr:splicing factor 45-like [Daphnia pulicaria]XP_046652747.1 splicing factor 45-like [Daphnia pulicaria]
MSLYDDIDENKAKSVTGWSSGIKLLHSQMHLKKAMITQPKREGIRRAIHPVIPPCLTATESQIKTEPEMTKNLIHQTPQLLTTIVPKQERSSLFAELEWDPNLEYDPLHPTDYDKIIRERKERRGIEIEIEEAEKKRKPRDDRDIKTRDRSSSAVGSGFAGRLHDEEEEPMVKKSSTSGGVAIAPPPSLQDTSSPSHPSLSSTGSGVGALGVAAKIMAKYGFKEGQGLGRQQQGIAAALQVEKTSKRGGRIINEKEIMPPPPPVVSPTAAPKAELTIADIMKNPSKVIYLRNMVGPGEVDSDLEPEVREECQTKYGDVNKVVIFEVPNAEEEEAVRIFVEFKRMEAAIKAVIDLNGRFFAGRQVKAGFYDVERFLKMELND